MRELTDKELRRAAFLHRYMRLRNNFPEISSDYATTRLYVRAVALIECMEGILFNYQNGDLSLDDVLIVGRPLLRQLGSIRQKLKRLT